MKIVNIDLTKPNWREEAKKISQYPIEFTLIDNLEEDSVSIMDMKDQVRRNLYGKVKGWAKKKR